MVMKIINIPTTDHQEIIQAACKTLSEGGLVVYPTETTYGIGVDATNPEAVLRLLSYKARREGKPFSIAVTDETMAAQYVELNDQARTFYKNFLPGPVTVVSKAKDKLAPGITSERGTVGVRIPNYDLIRDIIATYGKPITATSANASYKKRPYKVSDILDTISKKQRSLINLILDAGQLPINDPSTVIDTTLAEPAILRQGEVKLSEATTIITTSAEETQAIGEKLIAVYKSYLNEKAVIFALMGEMGAGKTQLSKGIARALKIDQLILSPTFTISREYPFSWGDDQQQFIHIDTWRLFSDEEFRDLGFTDMIDRSAVISIEWADKVAKTLKQYADEAKIIWVKLEYGKTENERIITYSDDLIES